MKPYARCRHCGISRLEVPISRHGSCPRCALERSMAQAAGSIAAAVTAKDRTALRERNRAATTDGG